MSRVSFRLPPSVHERAKKLAKRDGIPLEQLFALAVTEKVSALDTQDYLERRASRASLEKFKRALRRIPDRRPLKSDAVKSTK